MKIKIWGCRGSIASPGKGTLKYGGNTTCVQVSLNDGTILIFDAGSGIRNLGNHIIKNPSINEMYLFFTHAHWDHVNGFPFFRPAYSEKYTIHIRGGMRAKEVLKSYMDEQMRAPFFPVGTNNLKANLKFSTGRPKDQQIKNTQIIPIPLNHPNGGYGFKIIEDGKVFVFMPDNELEGKEFENGESYYTYHRFIKDADLLIHDAQYTPKEFEQKEGWGHSAFTSTIKLGMLSKVKKLGLFHHDPERTDAQLDRIGLLAAEIIKKEESSTECFIVYEGQEINL
ncbi:MAG: MBL fold metallo-hydrolase [Spirochaetales bacterium]|nr:MBL fold metallo-hydrolase [Spirochaetales bacterium]